MDGILALVQSIAGTDRIKLPKLLTQLKDHRAFQNKPNSDLSPIVQKITDLLNDLNTKHEGLLLLVTFLVECPFDILEQKGALWIVLCTKICAYKKPMESISLAYNVLGTLLKKSIHVPELSKAISSNLLSKIIETISHSHTPSIAHFSALKFLEIAMITFAGPCGSSKKAIETYILSFVDSQNDDIVKQTGKCLQLLQQIRGGGAQGISHKNAWAQLQSQLLGSLHQCLSELFTNTIDTFDVETQIEKLDVPEIELNNEPLPRALQLETRFVNLCKYFVTVLVEPFPVPKSIKPAKILELISRGLSVNCSLLSKNLLIDNIAVGIIIPRIHVALLKLLDSLIYVLRSHMLVYGHHIIQLMNQSLKWTASGKPNGFKRLFVTIRRATYFSLDLWCKTVYGSSGIEIISEDLIQQIIQDITPYHSEVKLQALAGSRKYLSKKARQKLIKVQNDSTNLSQSYSSHAQNSKVLLTDDGNEHLCAAALTCLNSIILSTGCFIKPTVHKILQEHIVSLAYHIVQSASLHQNLYRSADCRVKLYNSLYALVMAPQDLCPPPLRHAAKIFAIGQLLDVNVNVRNACNQHLLGIDKILHPQRHTLYFPVNPIEIREALKGLKNKSDYLEDDDDDDDDDSDSEEEILPAEEMETDDVNNVQQSFSTPEIDDNLIISDNEKENSENAVVVFDMEVNLNENTLVNTNENDAIPVQKQLRVMVSNDDVPLIYHKNIKQSMFEENLNQSHESVDLPVSESVKIIESNEPITLNDEDSENCVDDSLSVDKNVDLTNDSDNDVVEVEKIDGPILRSRKNKQIETIDVDGVVLQQKRLRSNQMVDDKNGEENLILLNSDSDDNDGTTHDQLISLFVDDGSAL